MIINGTIFIIQAAAILFAAASAFHDAPAVINYNHFGEKGSVATFHRANVWLKLFFCITAGFAGSTAIEMIEYFCLAGLWVYLAFDPILNMRTKLQKWHYLSINDSHGRSWIMIFKGNAGKWKVLILSVTILIANVIIQLTK